MSIRDIRRFGMIADIGPLTVYGWIVVFALIAVIAAAVKIVVS